MSVDLVDKGFAGIKEMAHGIVAEVHGDFFPHPLPEPFDGVQVRAIAGQRDEREAQFCCCGLGDSGSMPGSAVPDDDHRRGLVVQPSGQMMEELDRMFFVTTSFVPEETLSLGEVVGAIPVDAICKGWAATRTPSRFALGCPGVAQVHIPVDVGLIDIDQPDLLTADLSEELLVALDEGSSFLRIGLLQHLLAFLPTQLLFCQKGM
jgi:hypothetical protein